jgi:hypothetical protein
MPVDDSPKQLLIFDLYPLLERDYAVNRKKSVVDIRGRWNMLWDQECGIIRSLALASGFAGHRRFQAGSDESRSRVYDTVPKPCESLARN